MAHRFRYSRWDGSQTGFDLDALDLLDKMADQLANNGDPLAALRRLMERGMTDRNGESIQGLRDIMDQLQARKEELLESGDLGGVYSEIAEALDQIVEREHQGLEDRHAGRILRSASRFSGITHDHMVEDIDVIITDVFDRFGESGDPGWAFAIRHTGKFDHKFHFFSFLQSATS